MFQKLYFKEKDPNIKKIDTVIEMLEKKEQYQLENLIKPVNNLDTTQKNEDEKVKQRVVKLILNSISNNKPKNDLLRKYYDLWNTKSKPDTLAQSNVVLTKNIVGLNQIKKIARTEKIKYI